MNIFKYEMKMYGKSIIIWSLSMIGLIVMYMLFFSAFAADAALMDKILENYPPELLKAFGMDGSLSLSTVLGYFSFVFVFVQLCVAIQSSNYGFHLLSVEESELTADFLMSKPVSRTKIFMSKFFAAFTSLTITNFFIWLGSFGAIMLFTDGAEYNGEYLIKLLLTTFLFQLFFLSVGMFISMCVKKVRSVLSYSMALSFGLYILNSLRSIIGGEILGLISPFYHFEPATILASGEYDFMLVGINVGIIVISIIGSYILYLKRNIHSV
ncbi:ABC transporter permease subunit [Clostridium grantii]|uniref:ABC-2 type transport system permease protein n=1 Tax=Clostridium grantii DSM 8605 TaxID=1121316 RepID=A0A1M5VDQ6_9CLOT|nr:ABC transporter permease subunit [Clostridium grantii]SHH73325.1 ABC-2 type transport system permease protein [Clostridium grantii DSM 8605]